MRDEDEDLPGWTQLNRRAHNGTDPLRTLGGLTLFWIVLTFALWWRP